MRGRSHRGRVLVPSSANSETRAKNHLETLKRVPKIGQVRRFRQLLQLLLCQHERWQDERRKGLRDPPPHEASHQAEGGDEVARTVAATTPKREEALRIVWHHQS